MKKTRRIVLTALLVLSISVGTAGAKELTRPSVESVVSCIQNPQNCLGGFVQWLKSCLPQFIVPEQKPQEPEQKPETPEQKPEIPEQKPESSALHAFEKRVGELVNAERAKAGLKPLVLDESLSLKAREKSRDMAKNNYFSHNSPTYGTPFEMMQSMGITYRSAGENIAMGQRSPEAVVEAWMNSPGHRTNILSPSFTHLGVGYIADGNYWTQWFIG